MLRLHRYAIGLALLCTVVVLVVGSVLVGSRPAITAAGELANARSRWAEQPIRHYRLAIEASFGCLLDVEVRDEQVVQVFRQDDCIQPVRTVSDLFAMVERGRERRYCGDYRCACTTSLGTYALYDAQFGFPRRIVMRSQRSPNWAHQEFWNFWWRSGYAPPCAEESEVEMVAVQSLTPLR